MDRADNRDSDSERSKSAPPRRPGETHRVFIEDKAERLKALNRGHHAVENAVLRLEDISGAVYMVIMINECLNSYEYTPQGFDVPGFLRLYAALCAHLEDQVTATIPVDFLETVERCRETNTFQDEMGFVAQLETMGLDADLLSHLKEVLLKRAVIASSEGLADNIDLRPEVVLRSSLTSWVKTFIESEESWQGPPANMRQRGYIQKCNGQKSIPTDPSVLGDSEVQED